MLTLASKLKKDDGGKTGRASGASDSTHRVSIRDRLLTKEVAELEANLPSTCKASFPDEDKLHHFQLAVSPVRFSSSTVRTLSNSSLSEGPALCSTTRSRQPCLCRSDRFWPSQTVFDRSGSPTQAQSPPSHFIILPISQPGSKAVTNLGDQAELVCACSQTNCEQVMKTTYLRRVNFS